MRDPEQATGNARIDTGRREIFPSLAFSSAASEYSFPDFPVEGLNSFRLPCKSWRMHGPLTIATLLIREFAHPMPSTSKGRGEPMIRRRTA